MFIGALFGALSVVMAGCAGPEPAGTPATPTDCPVVGIVTWKSQTTNQVVISTNCDGSSFTMTFFDSQAHDRCALKDDFPTCKEGT